MKTVCFILINSWIFGFISYCQEKIDVDIHFMLRGNIYATSSIIDTTAIGGFGKSNNFQKKIDSNSHFQKKELILNIDTTQLITYEKKYNGYRFFIINNMDSAIWLDASDSRLYVIAEVFYKNKWQAIEYIPNSWCGNSYHKVCLNKGEYWEFRVPKFHGKIKTKLRYRLTLKNDSFIYSNEIFTSINKKQLERKEGHRPNGIMDAYAD